MELDDNDGPAHVCMYNIYADASLQKELFRECDFQLSVFRLTPGKAHKFYMPDESPFFLAGIKILTKW